MNTPSINRKFNGIATEDLLQELVARRQGLLAQIDTVLNLWKDAPARASNEVAASAGKPKKAAAPGKKAAKKVRAKAAKSGDGKSISDYALAALADGEARKPRDLVPLMTKAGWTSASKDPEKVLATTLKKLADNKKIKFLGKNTFKA